jgi:hypothetical protein
MALLLQQDPWCEELGALQVAMHAGQRAAAHERQLCAKMLGLGL